jgi:Zn-dependent protease/CBS domain-containing protein
VIGRSFRVATILGIPVKVDVSWLVIVVLLTTTLAAAFSQEQPGLGWPTWLLMGFSASMLLFGSVLAHELSHAVVALRQGITIRGITLFIFGGAAEMVDEPPHARAELKVALAGPAMSLALAVGFGTVYSIGLGWFPESSLGVLWKLALMNGILVAFNLVPGFPLDGGRVLRAVLWGIWGDLRYATRTASVVGSGFGVLIMLLGLVYVLPFGNLIGGIWYLFIGLFLRNAARASYQQVLVKDVLRGVKAKDLMNREVISVSPEATLEEIVDRVLLPTGLANLPVVEGATLVGLLGLREIRGVDRSRWSQVRANEIMRRDDVLGQVVSPEDDATRLLTMVVSDDILIPVMDGDRLVGIVTRPDLMRRLKLRMELPRS